jgi:hypothetical protein
MASFFFFFFGIVAQKFYLAKKPRGFQMKAPTHCTPLFEVTGGRRALFLTNRSPCSLRWWTPDSVSWRVRLPLASPTWCSQGLPWRRGVRACRRVFHFPSAGTEAAQTDQMDAMSQLELLLGGSFVKGRGGAMKGARWGPHQGAAQKSKKVGDPRGGRVGQRLKKDHGQIYFLICFNGVFELPSPKNTQKRDENKSRKNRFGFVNFVFFEKLFDTIFCKTFFVVLVNSHR